MFVYNCPPLITLAIAMVSLLIGVIIVRCVKIFQKFCIPAPVLGGLLFAILHLILYKTNVVKIVFDAEIKNLFMTIFFATVGLMASFKSLKKSGIKVLILGGITIGLIIVQNFVSLGIGSAMGWPYARSLAAGSIPLIGGHGTAASFGPILDKLDGKSSTVALVCATIGLILGSLMGSPLGAYLIKRKKLATPLQYTRDDIEEKNDTTTINENRANGIVENPITEDKNITLNKHIFRFIIVCVILAICAGLGELIDSAMKNVYIGQVKFTVPSYIWALIFAVIARNIFDLIHKEVPQEENKIISEISLHIFLSIALIGINLWELEDLGLGLTIILIVQGIIVFIVARYLVFNTLGKNYDSAVMTAGTCGYTLGATPNAMANMESLTNKYGESNEAFLILPIVSSVFSDIFNTLILTIFINVLPLIFA